MKSLGAFVATMSILTSTHSNINNWDTLALFAAFGIGAGLMLMTHQD